jgi:hypothetical protein
VSYFFGFGFFIFVFLYWEFGLSCHLRWSNPMKEKSRLPVEVHFGFYVCSWDLIHLNGSVLSLRGHHSIRLSSFVLIFCHLFSFVLRAYFFWGGFGKAFRRSWGSGLLLD